LKSIAPQDQTHEKESSSKKEANSKKEKSQQSSHGPVDDLKQRQEGQIKNLQDLLQKVESLEGSGSAESLTLKQDSQLEKLKNMQARVSKIEEKTKATPSQKTEEKTKATPSQLNRIQDMSERVSKLEQPKVSEEDLFESKTRTRKTICRFERY